MEYLVRFVCSPRKWRFFKQPMNLVDFFAIIPFMLDLVIGGLQVIVIAAARIENQCQIFILVSDSKT